MWGYSGSKARTTCSPVIVGIVSIGNRKNEGLSAKSLICLFVHVL